MKKLITVFTICFLALFISSCALAKVTDPEDPAFDLAQFNFEDYKDFKNFTYTMETLFPVGTSEEYINKVLVEYGGAEAHTKPIGAKQGTVIYTKDYRGTIWACRFIVKAIYDDERKLKNKIWLNHGCDAP